MPFFSNAKSGIKPLPSDTTSGSGSLTSLQSLQICSNLTANFCSTLLSNVGWAGEKEEYRVLDIRIVIDKEIRWFWKIWRFFVGYYKFVDFLSR